MMPKQELIVMVGLTPAQKESLPEGIIGIERTSNVKQLAMLYSGADAFMNPTWGDNFPTVNLEALACGTPVITYKTGGSPEAIDSSTGIVVEQGNIQGLCKAIETINTSKNMFTSRLCRQRATKLFNKDDCFIKYFRIYKNLLSK